MELLRSTWIWWWRWVKGPCVMTPIYHNSDTFAPNMDTNYEKQFSRVSPMQLPRILFFAVLIGSGIDPSEVFTYISTDC